MSKAKGGLFVLIDADCIIYDYQHLARLYQAHLAFPHAIIGGAIDGKGRSYVALADRFCHWATNIPGAEPGPVNSGHLVTAHMLIPRAAWEKLGYFNTDLRTGEDTAFCMKARRHGIEMRLHGDIVLGHYDRETWKDFLSCFYAVGRDRMAVRSAAHGTPPWYLSGPVLLRWLLIAPIAGALTFQHLRDWWPRDKRVVLTLPAIFLGMIAIAVGVAIGGKE
jgi:GT2 family glycosyltransferase